MARTTLRLSSPSAIAVTGPRAAAQEDEEDVGLARADALTAELHRLQDAAAEAETAAARLSAPGAPRLRLRAMVAVDPEATPPLAEILIKAERILPVGGPAEAGGALGPGSDAPEWLSGEALLQRLQCLQAAEASSSASKDGDAWAAAAAAARDGGQPGASAAAATEVERLSEELLVAQEDVSRMKAKYKAEKYAAKELREELAAAQADLAKSKSKLKAMKAAEPSLREELAAAQEELSRLRGRPEPEEAATAAAAAAERQAAPDHLQATLFRDPASSTLLTAALNKGAAGASIELKAQSIAKAIAWSFDNAIRAIEATQANLDKEGFEWE